MQKRIEVKVIGRVQGVFFRDFIQRKAKPFGILGTVANKDDGSVYLVAEGKDADLKSLIEFAKKGPMFAKVERMEIEWLKPIGDFGSFSIIDNY